MRRRDSGAVASAAASAAAPSASMLWYERLISSSVQQTAPGKFGGGAVPRAWITAAVFAVGAAVAAVAIVKAAATKAMRFCLIADAL